MYESNAEITLNAEMLQRAMHEQGYASAKELAADLGLHRNTVGRYLAGNAAIPGALARLLVALDLSPGETLSLRRRRRHVPGLAVSDLVELLHGALPGAAFVLFGSRARGSAKRFSDYDIGVYRSEGLEFSAYSRLLDLVAEWNRESLSTAQLADLTRADAAFVAGLAEDLLFLAGSHAAWCELLEKGGMKLHD